MESATYAVSYVADGDGSRKCLFVPQRVVLRLLPPPTKPLGLDFSKANPKPVQTIIHSFPESPWCETVWYGSITQSELNQALWDIAEQL